MSQTLALKAPAACAPVPPVCVESQFPGMFPGGVDQDGADVKVMHTAELLAEQLDM